MRIAVFLPNWIGDVVMATPALRALRNHFPAAAIAAIHKPYVTAVVEGCPWFDESLIWDKKGPRTQRMLATAWKMRQQQRFDLAILFPNSFRPAMAAWLAGCRKRIGYRRYGRGWLLSRVLEPVRDEHGRIKPSPIIDAYNLLARAAGCGDPGYRMELFTSPADEAAADTIWEQEGLDRKREVICLNPGAAFGAAKYWPVESFATVARQLVAERNCGVLVLCGPSEADLARRLVAKADCESVRSLAEHRQSIGLTKACVRRSDLLITTDSGPRHFAAAFGRPVVSLFGPTHIAWTETYFAKEICLQEKVPCGPCQLRVCPLDHRCMTQLRPETVLAAAMSLLTRFGRESTPGSRFGSVQIEQEPRKAS